MIAGSYFLVSNGLFLRWKAVQSVQIKNIILYGMVGFAIVYSIYLRNQKEKMQSIHDFDEKLIAHQRYFKTRMWWYLLSTVASCILYILVAHTFFLYFALFELLMLIVVFPNKFFFKKELQDDDIIFL
jgi:hypothetical protein